MWNGNCLPGNITSRGSPLTQGWADCSRLLPGLSVLFLWARTLSLCLFSEYSCASRAPTRSPAPSDLWFKTSLVAQWLRLCFHCRGMGSIPCQVSFTCCTVRKKKKNHKTYSSISSFHLLRLLSEVFGHQLIRRAPSPPLKLLWVLFFHLLPLLLSFVTSILLWSYSILFLPLSLSFHHLNPLDTFWFLLR